MMTLAGLRRATPDDLAALIALQLAAYAENRAVLGLEPVPLQWDYRKIMADKEVWLSEGEAGLDGALILDPRADYLEVASIATLPSARGRALGRRLLAAADERARSLRLDTIRLYTGEKMVKNIDWYQRCGFLVEWIETLPDRKLVHMVKRL
jgi:ribosomal protein S18 acetylase RimI-like enzyme